KSEYGDLDRARRAGLALREALDSHQVRVGECSEIQVQRGLRGAVLEHQEWSSCCHHALAAVRSRELSQDFRTASIATARETTGRSAQNHALGVVEIIELIAARRRNQVGGLAPIDHLPSHRR